MPRFRLPFEAFLALMFVAFAALSFGAVRAAPESMDDLLAMSDQLDQMDKNEFRDLISAILRCSAARDFTCADQKMAKATKLAADKTDKDALEGARNAIAAERETVRIEAEIKLAEERQRKEAARMVALEEECQESCPDPGEFNRCVAGRLTPQHCGYIPNSGSDSGGVDMTGIAILAGIQGAFQGAAQISTIHNDMIANIQAQAAERERTERQQAARMRAQDDRNRAMAAEQRAAMANAAARQASAERLARLDAERAGTEAKANQEAAAYQQPVVAMEPWRTNCPPGYEPARQKSEQPYTAPSAGYCVKSSSLAANAAPSGGASNLADSGSQRTTRTAQRGSNAANDVPAPGSATMKTKWGPVKPEALAICHQHPSSRKWKCYGPVQNQLLYGSPSLESALANQQCSAGSLATGGAIVDGDQWSVYRCGHSLGHGDNDVTRRYPVVTTRNSYICPADQAGDGRCTTIYTGQDKR